jgi:hypothetical protein
MGTEYPDHLLAREPAPPYDGEGAFALWHFSEDPSLGRFCPRGCIWPVSATTREDREQFFGQSSATRIQVMETGWLRQLQDCRLYAYRLPTGPFRPHDVGGYWVADEPVDAFDQVVIDDLAGRHATAGIELRITPSIWPFWRRVTSSTVEFSGSRLRNSAAHPERFG